MKRSRAFTIVELLVVISVIALLVSLLLPALKSARDQAVISTCQARQRGLGIAATAYATDSKGFFPYSYYGNHNGPSYGGADATNTAQCVSANNLLMSYVGNLNSLYCPTAYGYFWPTNGGMFNAYKTWTPGSDLYMGYTKYVGCFGKDQVKPMNYYATIGGVNNDIGNVSRYMNLVVGGVKHDFEPNTVNPYFRPYASLAEMDRAGICVPSGGLWIPTQVFGPSGVIMWEDTNYQADTLGYARFVAHNTLQPGQNNLTYSLTYTTGINSVFGDGHVEWAINNNVNTASKVINIDDGQVVSLNRSARY